MPFLYVAHAADAYLTKNIRFVIPFRPGGATDVVTRIVAQKLNGIFVPDGTPSDVVSKLNTQILRMVRSGEVRELLLKRDAESYATTPDEFTKAFERDIARWATVVKASGAKAS